MSSNSPEENDPQRPEVITSKVTFVGGEDVPILLANHIFVRVSPDGFQLSFAQSHGPYRLNLTPEEMAQEEIPAKIIARLFVPTNRMVEMVNVLKGLVETTVEEVTVDEGESEDGNGSNSD